MNPQLVPPPPLPPLSPDFASNHQIALSASQQSHIKDVFDLFDTDGGGTIDRKELEYALVALGFRSKIAKSAKEREDLCPAITHLLGGDDTVTLEEFSALMTGEVGGGDPRDMLRAIFAVMSQEDPCEAGSKEFTEKSESTAGQITVPKLERVCRDFKVNHRLHSMHCYSL